MAQRAGQELEEEMEHLNPFTVPSDEEVFRIRENEMKKKSQDKHTRSNLKIHEKTTNSSRMGRINNRTKLTDAGASIMSSGTSSQSHTRGLVAAATATISSSGDRRREKENMTSFLARKREMFLVQMALDTKREEIRKLEEKAHLKEEALKKSELMLEEDAIRFDTFLKENDKKAHEAIKLAENESKAKAEKVQEIKRLNQQIQLVQSEMSKLKEQLEDCLKYKQFLDELTPVEYIKEQQEQKKQRKGDAKDKVKANELDTEDSEDEMPMYFQEPQQLLDIFTALEESNLFLIQNSQETEQALEELKQNFRETTNKMDAKTAILQDSILSLEHQIEYESSKSDGLRGRTHQRSDDDKQEKVLGQLHDSVREVYRRCGFDADSNPSTLFMLTDLEARLEDLLQAIELLPEEVVIKAEKEKEKERRERVRQERISTQKKMYEDRMKKSMERSLQAPRKRRGRQVMWRSQPQRKAKAKEHLVDNDVDDQADQQFFME